jgi:hypothetical protein
MQLRSILVGAAAGALLAAGVLWGASQHAASPVATDAPPVAAAASGSLEARIEALRTELAAERDARLGLSAEVEMLRLLLEDGGRELELTASPAKTAGVPPPAGGDAAAQRTDPHASAAGVQNAVDRSWFDAQSLLESGVSAADVARLQTAFEESTLQTLQLRDQATREGWFGTPRFMQAMVDQRLALRASLGDEVFDQYLFATHKPNRVRARSVLATGPAGRAGLQPRDLILRYDGKSVFGSRELQRETTRGEAGRLVPVDVMSENGVVRRLMLPSGPLGVQLVEERLPPLSVR